MNKKTTILIATCWLIVASGDAHSQPDSLWSVRFDTRISGSILLHDGNYAFTGYAKRQETVYKLVTKKDAEGETIWESSWQDQFNYREIVETPDSGLAIIGWARDSSMIRKFDRNGDLLDSWQFEFAIEPQYTSLINDEDGSYVSAGYAWVSDDLRNDFFC